MYEFEKKLQKMPLRTIPSDWKDEILKPMTQEQADEKILSWHFWLWPSPKAWTAVATSWLIICGLNFYVGTLPGTTKQSAMMTEPQKLLEIMIQQRKILAILQEPPSPERTEPPSKKQSIRVLLNKRHQGNGMETTAT